jgi:hypothetical protein
LIKALSSKRIETDEQIQKIMKDILVKKNKGEDFEIFYSKLLDTRK